MRLYAILPTLFLCMPLAAQDLELGPAEEQARFHQIIGHWRGSGTVRAMPDAQAMPWTAVSVAKTVLGGHFVQEDTIIDLGQGAPAKLVYRTYYGYDREAKKWMQYSLTNFGVATESEVHWINGKMVTGGATRKVGRYIVERSSTSFTPDTYTISHHEAHGDGGLFQSVRGTFKRVNEVDACATDKSVKGFMPPSEEMGYLTKWAGKYRLEGWTVIMPGLPRMDIAVTETITPIFGGLAIELRMKSDPVPQQGSYEVWCAILWSPDLAAYQVLWIENTGAASLDNAHVIDGKFVVGAARVEKGMPVVSHTVVSVNKDGIPTVIDEHKMFGDGGPVHTMQAAYTKQ